MKIATVTVLVMVALSASQTRQTFTGTISDDVCAKGDHSRMRMGSTDADCTNACVDAHGAAYVLYDGKTAFTLKGQQPLQKFAGQKVTITGALDTKTGTIQVDSIAPAK